ncbi:MAG: thymidine kinase [Clostridiales bacterium]|nr:thymidine kinase [Clostridiales bacterium]
MAKLYFRFAVMNAGKSTQLLQIAYDYEHNNKKKILCLKPGVDTKQESSITSRLEDGVISRECDFLIHPKEGWLYERLERDIKDSKRKGNQISLVLIDEAQFMSKANVWELARIVTYYDVPVICFGLKTDAFGEPFEGSAYLFALAQDIEEVTTRAICHLSDHPKKASMILRKVNGVPIFEGAQVAIDNDEEIEYLPVCLQEYIKLKDSMK